MLYSHVMMEYRILSSLLKMEQEVQAIQLLLIYGNKVQITVQHGMIFLAKKVLGIHLVHLRKQHYTGDAPFQH